MRALWGKTRLLVATEVCFVIPAKAGIQCFCSLAASPFWIPAFAGMTSVDGERRACDAPESRVPSPESRVPSPESRVPSPESDSSMS